MFVLEKIHLISKNNYCNTNFEQITFLSTTEEKLVTGGYRMGQ